jgi:hypothetical protein
VRATSLVAATVLALSTAGAAPPVKWTVMVFMNGDNDLEPDAITDFKEMAQVADNPLINVIVQFDRIPGHTAEYGDWTQTLRFRIRQNLVPTKENALEDIGEANMGDPAVLRDFVRWGKTKFPAEHYMLVIWDHGQGWRLMLERALDRQKSGGSKPASFPTTYRCVSYDDTNNDQLYNSEIQDALANEKIDVIGFDACLMSMVETSYAMRKAARVLVGSEELEPGEGWQYDDWLGKLCARPTMTPRELGRLLVDSYARTYVDADPKTTLSAIDLTKIDNLAKAITAFSDELMRKCPTQFAQIKTARSECATYSPQDNRFFHVDFARFCERIGANSPDQQLRRLAEAARVAVKQSVIANYAGRERQGNFGSNGLAIYFPESKTVYANDALEQGGYQKNNTFYPVAFVKEQHWADFLHTYWDKVP